MEHKTNNWPFQKNIGVAEGLAGEAPKQAMIASSVFRVWGLVRLHR
jgi:hypothetical protein